MLYIFAGFPKCGLNAGGIQQFIETEDIGLLEKKPIIQYKRENIISAEDILSIEYRISELCERDGIGWCWFPKNWSFGNGVTVHKTTARYHNNIVFHEEDGELKWEKIVEDRSSYEERWAPGTCPNKSHVVHLTWCVFQHKLPEFAYEKLRVAIEDPTYELRYKYNYEEKHFSVTRKLEFLK